MLNLLSELVDKSLVAAASLDDGSTWYRLSETMGQYGWQRLTGSGETVAVQRRLTVFYLALSERAEGELWGPDALHWSDGLVREHDNQRAALTWCLAQAGASTGCDGGVGDRPAHGRESALVLALPPSLP